MLLVTLGNSLMQGSLLGVMPTAAAWTECLPAALGGLCGYVFCPSLQTLLTLPPLLLPPLLLQPPQLPALPQLLPLECRQLP